jgi:hypothetical protein
MSDGSQREGFRKQLKYRKYDEDLDSRKIEEMNTHS